MEARQIIIRPIITERSFDMQDFNRYTFEVAKTASKIEIAKAIEEPLTYGFLVAGARFELTTSGL